MSLSERCLNAFVQALYAALSSLSDTCLAFILTNGNVKNIVEKLDCPFSSEAKDVNQRLLPSLVKDTHTPTHRHTAMQYYN